MASSMVEDRRRKLESLKNFVEFVEERVKAIAGELKWSTDSLVNTSELVTCSIHPEHRVQRSNLNQHEEMCRWLEKGYHPQDVPFPDNPGNSCVVFTPELQETVIRNASSEDNVLDASQTRDVPQSSTRYQQDFSQSEKLALYEYVLANTCHQQVYADLSIVETKEGKSEKKTMTPIEIAAAERDAKRRRASYRNKVHTNRKTHTEILREVIDSQMEVFKEEISLKNRAKDSCSVSERDYYDKSSNSVEEHQNRSHYRSHKFNNRSNHHSKHRYDSRDWKYKSKKHKRSRSRSGSREKNKHRRCDYSDRYSSRKGYDRY